MGREIQYLGMSCSRASLLHRAMHLFYRMHTCNEEEIEPTAITVAVLIPFCTKLRLLKQGKSLHGYCIKRGLEVGAFMGNMLVSMNAKCGRVIADAQMVFDLISDKDVSHGIC